MKNRAIKRMKYKLDAQQTWILLTVCVKHISPQLLSHYHLILCFALTVQVCPQMNVSKGSLEAVHTLVWTSQLPLNCVSHSVRIRLISGASPSSSWSSWKTIYGRIFKVHFKSRLRDQEGTSKFKS